MELTASTALQLWYGNMQSAIMEGRPLGDADTLGYNFLHYACLEGNLDVRSRCLRGFSLRAPSAQAARLRAEAGVSCLRAYQRPRQPPQTGTDAAGV